MSYESNKMRTAPEPENAFNALNARYFRTVWKVIKWGSYAGSVSLKSPGYCQWMAVCAKLSTQEINQLVPTTTVKELRN